MAFLGDYLGRGDNERCVRRIREVADVAILGNRDLDWQDRVSPAIRAWVLRLAADARRVGPLLLGARRRAPDAGAEHQPDRPRFSAEPGARCSAWTRSVWAFGHSHHARVWRKASAAQPAELLLGRTVGQIEPGYRYFLNVGTTGPAVSGQRRAERRAGRFRARPDPAPAIGLQRIGSE